MKLYPFITVDVFTEQRFGGNQLAVFFNAEGLTAEQMHSLAAEFNLSETTFVLPPEKPGNTARVRIFTRTAEMPFAGHPTVGTAYVLAQQGRDKDGELLFEVPAGLVKVKVERDAAGKPVGALVAAPQPLTVGEEFPVEAIAACAGLEASDIITTYHKPVLASVGTRFVIAEVGDEALKNATPNIEPFRRLSAECPHLEGRVSLHLYTRLSEGKLRARMFAPLSGTWEDPATGSANAPLAALLLSLSDKSHHALEVMQGVEMKRPSLLNLTATRGEDGIRATVGGRCVPVLRGEAMV